MNKWEKIGQIIGIIWDKIDCIWRSIKKRNRSELFTKVGRYENFKNFSTCYIEKPIYVYQIYVQNYLFNNIYMTEKKTLKKFLKKKKSVS